MAGPETGRIGRFLVVGGLSVATDLAVYTVLLLTALPVPVAKGLAYLAGMLLGFFLNKAWTFASQRGYAGEALTYVTLYLLSLAINIAVNEAAIALLDGHVVPTLARGLAFLAATGTTTVLNYLGMRYITFRKGIAMQDHHA
jgi:putative flippase GtrA